jgi:DNA-binding Xre family transcriptional regulator
VTVNEKSYNLFLFPIAADKGEGVGMLQSKIDDVLWMKRMRVKDLIDRSGLNKGTIARARNNETLSSCTLQTLEAIARALGVSIKDLFDEIPDPDPESQS